MPTHQHLSRPPSAPLQKSSVPAHALTAVKTGTQGGGQALDKRTNAEMSAKFGHDFSSIRIHTDSRAGEAAGAMGANAYALGGDIVFGAGKYNPGSRETERLLAHELTHVVQQAQFGPGDWGRTSLQGDASEREADGLASQVMMGRSVQVQAAPGAAVARDDVGIPTAEDGTWPPPQSMVGGSVGDPGNDSAPAAPTMAVGHAAGGSGGTEPGFGGDLANTAAGLISGAGSFAGGGVAEGAALLGGMAEASGLMEGGVVSTLGGAVGGAVSGYEDYGRMNTSYGKDITNWSQGVSDHMVTGGENEFAWSRQLGARGGSAVSNGANGVANWVEDLGQ
jgi:hypothetical protein